MAKQGHLLAARTCGRGSILKWQDPQAGTRWIDGYNGTFKQFLPRLSHCGNYRAAH
jgi:hypothetical protein